VCVEQHPVALRTAIWPGLHKWGRSGCQVKVAGWTAILAGGGAPPRPTAPPAPIAPRDAARAEQRRPRRRAYLSMSRTAAGRIRPKTTRRVRGPHSHSSC
jgi:hypothetical protein